MEFNSGPPPQPPPSSGSGAPDRKETAVATAAVMNASQQQQAAPPPPPILKSVEAGMTTPLTSTSSATMNPADTAADSKVAVPLAYSISVPSVSTAVIVNTSADKIIEDKGCAKSTSFTAANEKIRGQSPIAASTNATNIPSAGPASLIEAVSNSTAAATSSDSMVLPKANGNVDGDGASITATGPSVFCTTIAATAPSSSSSTGAVVEPRDEQNFKVAGEGTPGYLERNTKQVEAAVEMTSSNTIVDASIDKVKPPPETMNHSLEDNAMSKNSPVTMASSSGTFVDSKRPDFPVQEIHPIPSSTHDTRPSSSVQPSPGGATLLVDNGNGGTHLNNHAAAKKSNHSAKDGNVANLHVQSLPAAPGSILSSGHNAIENLSSGISFEQPAPSSSSSASGEVVVSAASSSSAVPCNSNTLTTKTTTDLPSSGANMIMGSTSSAPAASSLNAPHTQPPNNATSSAAPSNINTNPNNSNVLHSTGRELKVEDALLYLDQVKLEFGDRPRIYNEFLEIMKNFKAQEVDTIGVINRVRSLFHGYNNLILGFNTFLPEGYKIEMRDLEPVFVGPGLSGTTHTPGYMPPPGPGGGSGRGIPPGRGGPPHPGGRGIGHGPPPPAFRVGLGGRGIPPPGPGRGMIGRGPPPSGPSGRGMPGRGAPPQLGPAGRGVALPGGRGGAPMTGGRGGLPPPPPQGRIQPMSLQQQQMMQAHNVQQKQAQMQLQLPQQQDQQHHHQSLPMDTSQQRNATRTIEFDHAIMYVTNIKKRFANQPRIYHTFLEILHTYQKEQRGIKEVLEQVSSLFADHPDLLREFTFFLPDAVQEQAKERLSRAAAEAEAKQRAAAVEAAAKQQQHQAQIQQAAAMESGKLKSAPTGWRTSAIGGGGPTPKVGKMGQSAGMEPLIPSGTQKFIDMTQPVGVALESPRRPSASDIGGAGIDAKKQTQQDIFIYNAGVERQFFDLVKAALTSFSRDGQAYAEFIKTLDMYAQEILSRSDMLGYVERLLGKHKDLFEEFKRIITAVGSPDAPTHDDSWHSVPLSEIDFTRCRRCSPSYRALPRDYPNPPCSERSEEESKVLNDVWVSLPMGSEENSTFRHMRKNQYEETLFQCEDMRFEIDMCIDSNAATLQRLIKISDELQFLSENELMLTKGSSVKKLLVPDGAGFGGKIYQYTLDGRVLGVIHKHAIKRIYGDDGNEMLELCFKNPTVALPIVVNRLRQKDEEWRAARDALNKKWKDLAELNYYMSLDHRSITWRTIDKRATSTRSLVAEIKDRAAHNGYEGEAASSVRIEKAKEEHGTFYEVTMGCAIPRKMDLTGFPLPTKTIFTPHLSFMYENSSWAQHDAYRIISFALERGSVNPGDKERCHRLWCDFIGPWFGLSLAWMQSPAAYFTWSSEPLEDDEDAGSTSADNGEKENGNDDKEVSSTVGVENTTNNTTATGKTLKEARITPNSASTNNNAYFSTTNHIPFPPDTVVSTTFGEGKIIQYIEQDGVYEVAVPPESDDASTAYLRIDSVYGSYFPVEPSRLTEQLRENDQEELERPDDQLIIGTQCLYLFFRLHQLLIRRLTIAKKLAKDVSNDLALGKHVEKITFEGDINEGEKRYEAFLDLLYSLIDAGTNSAESSEGGKYEDRVMHLLGNNAYELTTMDKLLSHVLKHLQNMANDDVLQNMFEIYRRHRLSGTFKPSAFREEASLMSDGENMYAFQICNIPKKDQMICHCDFLGCIAEDIEDEEIVALENEDNKRSVNYAVTDDTDDLVQEAKRQKRDV